MHPLRPTTSSRRRRSRSRREERKRNALPYAADSASMHFSPLLCRFLRIVCIARGVLIWTQFYAQLHTNCTESHCPPSETPLTAAALFSISHLAAEPCVFHCKHGTVGHIKGLQGICWLKDRPRLLQRSVTLETWWSDCQRIRK